MFAVLAGSLEMELQVNSASCSMLRIRGIHGDPQWSHSAHKDCKCLSSYEEKWGQS